MFQTIQTAFDFLVQRPLIMLFLMAFPLLLISHTRKVYPSRRLLWFAAIPASLSVLIIIAPVVGWYVLTLDLLLGLIAIVDLLSVPREHLFSATRKVLRIASLAKPQEVEIELTNRSKSWCRIAIKDDLPQCFQAKPEQVELAVAGQSRTLFRYEFTSSLRGQQFLPCIHLRVTSMLGLWNGFFKLPCESIVDVYPDMRQISEYDLLAKTNRLSLMGLRRTRKIGQDNEFERLRDYTPDDNYRHIDWRTTARRRKLTVRDFQANQSQRIIFMVDCGRMMTGQGWKHQPA